MTDQLQLSRPSLRQDERGMALALAIFALVIIATLVSGVFFMARLEQRSGSSTLWATQAAEAADAGLNETLANWTAGGFNSLAVGGSTTMPTAILGSSGGSTARHTVTVSKVSPEIFLVESRGEKAGAGGVLSGTTVGKIVRIIRPSVNINAAVTSNGPVTLQGNLTVDGRDKDPPYWPVCGATLDTVAAVRTSQDITAKGSYSAYGDPPPEGLVSRDPGVTASNFSIPYAAFTAPGVPNKTTTGAWSASNSPRPVLNGATPAVCDRADFRNFGEPWRSALQGTNVTQCAPYSPIVWIKHPNGNAHISGGRGQGILVVDGDLEMSGGFEYTGIILVMGDVRTTGQGAKITGALLVANETIGDATYIGGTPVVTYSSCAIATALGHTVVARPLAERSWVQLY